MGSVVRVRSMNIIFDSCFVIVTFNFVRIFRKMEKTSVSSFVDQREGK